LNLPDSQNINISIIVNGKKRTLNVDPGVLCPMHLVSNNLKLNQKWQDIF